MKDDEMVLHLIEGGEERLRQILRDYEAHLEPQRYQTHILRAESPWYRNRVPRPSPGYMVVSPRYLQLRTTFGEYFLHLGYPGVIVISSFHEYILAGIKFLAII
jgi:hypothetical protein